MCPSTPFSERTGSAALPLLPAPLGWLLAVWGSWSPGGPGDWAGEDGALSGRDWRVSGESSCSVCLVHPAAHRGLKSPFADGWGPCCTAPRAGLRSPQGQGSGDLFCSQNKCYHNSRKAFLCLSVRLGIWDNEGNVSQAWVTVWLESHMKELQLRLDPNACLVGPCWHRSAVPSPGLFPSPVPGTGAGEAATVPAPGQCTNWWGRHAENQWRGNGGATGCSLSLLGAGRPRPETVVE